MGKYFFVIRLITISSLFYSEGLVILGFALFCNKTIYDRYNMDLYLSI